MEVREAESPFAQKSVYASRTCRLDLLVKL